MDEKLIIKPYVRAIVLELAKTITDYYYTGPYSHTPCRTSSKRQITHMPDLPLSLKISDTESRLLNAGCIVVAMKYTKFHCQKFTFLAAFLKSSGKPYKQSLGP